VRWPIISGGRIRANIHVQEARQEQALRQYEKAVLVAVEEVENAISAHARNLRRQADLRASVAASRRALDLAMERYIGGLESYLSVLDAQRSLYAAEDLLIQSESSTAVDLIAVYKALGGGWEEEGRRGLARTQRPRPDARGGRGARPARAVDARTRPGAARGGAARRCSGAARRCVRLIEVGPDPTHARTRRPGRSAFVARPLPRPSARGELGGARDDVGPRPALATAAGA
jgi:hypothetical protein